MARPRKSAPEPPRQTFGDMLAAGLVKRRDQLPGNPDPVEIGERVQKIMGSLRLYQEIWPNVRMGDKGWLWQLRILFTREFFPDNFRKLEELLEPCHDIVDEGLASLEITDRTLINIAFLQEASRKIDEVAARKFFQQAQEEARARLARKAQNKPPLP